MLLTTTGFKTLFILYAVFSVHPLFRCCFLHFDCHSCCFAVLKTALSASALHFMLCVLFRSLKPPHPEFS